VFPAFARQLHIDEINYLFFDGQHEADALPMMATRPIEGVICLLRAVRQTIVFEHVQPMNLEQSCHLYARWPPYALDWRSLLFHPGVRHDVPLQGRTREPYLFHEQLVRLSAQLLAASLDSWPQIHVFADHS
jgi:hypothetical protein